MRGDWAVQTGTGTHTVQAELTVGLTMKLVLHWDSQLIDQSTIWVLAGDLKSFQRDGHLFVVAHRGIGMFGSLALLMDGVEVSRQSASAVTPAPVNAAPPPTLQFVKELSMAESEEILGAEEYPLDNRYGDQNFSTVRQVSRESVNELSLETDTHLGGKLGVEILSAIKAEIEAQVSQQTGQKIGQKVTESQTLTFTVGPKSAVTYEVVWKRKVRTGERLYLSAGAPLTVPYRINYGLSCAVRTKPQPTAS